MCSFAASSLSSVLGGHEEHIRKTFHAILKIQEESFQGTFFRTNEVRFNRFSST